MFPLFSMNTDMLNEEVQTFCIEACCSSPLAPANYWKHIISDKYIIVFLFLPPFSILTLFCLGGADSVRADFKFIVLKEHSSNHGQTLSIFLKIIWEHFGVSICLSHDLMFGTKSFDRPFYPNLVFSA